MIHRIKKLTPLGYAVLYGGIGLLAYKFLGKKSEAAPNPAAAAPLNGLGSMVSVASPNGLTTSTLTVFRGQRPMKVGEFGIDGQGRHWVLSRVIERGGVATLVLSHPNGSQSMYQSNISRVKGLRVAKMPVGI